MVTALPLLLYLSLALLPVRGRDGPWEKRREGEGMQKEEGREGERERERERETEGKRKEGRVVGKDRVYNTATIPAARKAKGWQKVLHSILVPTSFYLFYVVPCIK